MAAQDAGGGSKVLYAAQCAVGGGWSATLSVVNMESTAGEITLQVFDESGMQIGSARTMPVAAQGKVIVGPGDLPVGSAQNMFRGYVVLRSNGPRISGSITYGGDGDDDYFSSSLPLQRAVDKDVVLSQVASSSTWFTGLALLNPHGSEMTATIRLIDRDGREIAGKTGPRNMDRVAATI